MKKFLTAAVAGILIFGGQVAASAAAVDLSEPTVQTQEVSAWPRIRDSLLGRPHHDRDRHHRDWERHHHYDDHHRYRPPHHGAPPPRR